MRYFLDTEYNGWRGELLSLALVPEDGGQEFYVTTDWSGPIEPWVERHVVPYLDTVPETMISPRFTPGDAARELSQWLIGEQESHVFSQQNGHGLEIVADWPEDISQMCSLLTVGPGLIVDIPPVTFRLIMLPGWSTAANSKVPHNALHDARALRDHVVGMD
jgi:hypothetical protein